MKTRTKHTSRGFTMIELMVTVAIIALLGAIAIPEYMKFVSRSKRAEAYVLLNGGHKTQQAYFASHDHFLNTCAPGTSCVANSTTMNGLLGVDTGSISLHGYDYDWYFEAGSINYTMTLWRNFDTDPRLDALILVVNNPFYNYCKPAGLQDGVPFLFSDDILEKYTC